MKTRVLFLALLFLVSASSESATARRATVLNAPVETYLRIASIGFISGSETGEQSLEAARLRVAEAIESAISREGRVSLIDPGLWKPALAGVGYNRSINMSRDEARRLGAAIGCDFIITGKAETLLRSQSKNESHEESYAGVMIIDSRTGALALFDFISEKAGTKEAALNQLAKTLQARAADYIAKMFDYRARQASVKSIASDASTNEPVEDLPAEGSPQAVGFAAPEFLNRVKPDYTNQADLANISATVEAKAVFRASGEVGEVEIIRWAGFGLDDAAVRAIRQLRFKPATRDQKNVSVRALVQYNFRRKN